MSVSASPNYGIIAAAAAEGTLVTLSGGSASGFDPITANAGFQFRSDGSVYRKQNSSFVRVSASTDWIIPNEDASAQYEIRCNFTGEAPTSSDAINTWLSLSTNRIWQAQCTGNEIKEIIFTIEIRFDGGPVLATNNYFAEVDCA